MNPVCRIGFILAAMLLVSFTSVPAIAQQDEAAALDKGVEDLYRAGKLSEAMPLAQRALAIHEKARGPDHPDVAISLNNRLCSTTAKVATPKPSRSTSDRWRFSRKHAVPTILTSRYPSTAWLSCTNCKVATPMPNCSTSESWRSGKKRSLLEIPMSMLGQISPLMPNRACELAGHSHSRRRQLS